MTPARRLIICVGCGQQAAHHAKGRCARCYPSTRARTATCADCGQLRPQHRGGRCARCYRHAQTVLADCAICHERRATQAGTCRRCKQRRRAGGGTCTGCGRAVDRLWSGRRCARCAKTSWTVGSCCDCLAWASSIAAGRCRACREFARRGRTGQCRSCQRELAINRHGRCRLCTASRRDARLAGEYDGDVEPGERAGIQLFFADIHGQRWPSPASGDQTGPAMGGDDHDGRDHDGQLGLFASPRRVRHLDALLADWTRSADGGALLTGLAGFAAARGWPPATTRAVGHGLARAAVAEPAFDLDPATITWLRRHYVPIGRLHEFLTAHGLQPQLEPQSTGSTTTTRWAGFLCAGLPSAMTTEVIAWLEALTATSGRGRARARSTIDHYTAAVAPALTGFAARYDSLRQASEDDIAAQLDLLRGSARTATAVALRSLFATLKSRRLIFADPTRRVHPGRFPRRPVLGLDPATRRALLDQLTRADHRLMLLLAGVHALSRADITGLRLDDVDLRDDAGTLTTRGTRRNLDEPTRTALACWLQERRRRWPATANPHLLISTRSALGLGPVSTGYLRGVTANLPVTLHQLRADRLLTHARDTDGDPLSLHRLFGISADTAVRYCTELDVPTPGQPPRRPHRIDTHWTTLAALYLLLLLQLWACICGRSSGGTKTAPWSATSNSPTTSVHPARSTPSRT